MSTSFTLIEEFNTDPQTLYNSWLDSDIHAEMTAGINSIQSHKIGAEHMAHDSYIWGKNLELEPGKKIVQSWRTTEFSEDHPDSKIEVILEDLAGKTKLTLIHSNILQEDHDYENGWKLYYFDPMKNYFHK